MPRQEAGLRRARAATSLAVFIPAVRVFVSATSALFLFASACASWIFA